MVISYYIHYNVWGVINYLFPNFNDATASDLVPHLHGKLIANVVTFRRHFRLRKDMQVYMLFRHVCSNIVA